MKKGPKKVICFFTDNQTFEELHQHSDKRDISVSQLLRSLVRKFLASANQTITQDNSLPSELKHSDAVSLNVGGKKHD